MKAYTNVSRKTVGEDRVAICSNFGCEFISRVKPLKFGFLGFGKYPKCKKHRIPLVYIDERISDFVDAALACLFDKSGLPPSELHESIKSKFPDEFNSFIEGWVYCITVGRGAPIVSHYMDTISNAYLKQLTKKQIKAFKKGDDSRPNLVNKAIKEGMDEITIQYTRVLKHLRAHSEILIKHNQLKPLSNSLKNHLISWQKNTMKQNMAFNSEETKQKIPLLELKTYYDQILNVGTCRGLIGLNPESKDAKKAKLTAFDRFSAYHNFYTEKLAMKFTKSDINDISTGIKLSINKNDLNYDKKLGLFKSLNQDKSHIMSHNENSSSDNDKNLSGSLVNHPNENMHILENFSSILQELKSKYKNQKITRDDIIEHCELTSNFRKSGILTKESFEKLQNLLGRSIEYESILGSYRKNKVLNIRHSRKLAEFIGILIAKGYIEKDRIRINLSGVCKNQLFLDYMKELLIEIFLIQEERLYFKLGKDMSYIRVNSIVVLHELRKLGVISEISNGPVIPKWIFTRKDFIVSCLKGMFEIAGQLIVNSRGSLEIRFIRPKYFIVECFRDLCFRLGLELSRIYSYQRKMEIYSNNSSISKKFYVIMSKKTSLERFFNLISTLKWELSKDRIQSILEDRGSSLAEVLEFKFKYDKRDKILRQAPFEYNLDYLCHIPNPIITQKLSHLFHIIDDRLFSLDMFGKDSLRCSMFRIKGSQQMKLFSSFFKPYEDDLLNRNYVIVNSINGQKLSQMILNAESFYKNKDSVFSIGNNIKHYFLQRHAFKFKPRYDSILASELLLWSEVNDNQFDINHITGHADYLVYNPSCDTFYLCDYKPDEISFLPIIPQVAMYGILFKKYLDLKNINVKCIVFNKNYSWEFDPFILYSRIPSIVNDLKNKGFPIEPIWRIKFQ